MIIGIGERGAVFARGLRRLGHPIHPITRGGFRYDAAGLAVPELRAIAAALKS